MLFSILGITKDVPITSVILESDSQGNLLCWHCPICNQPLFQFRGQIVAIVPGMVPVEIPIIHICNKCHRRYMVTGIAEA